VKNDSLRSMIVGALKDLWVKLNEKSWFFWLLFLSRKKVTTPRRNKLEEWARLNLHQWKKTKLNGMIF
jgi:hypothetical protein